MRMQILTLGALLCSSLFGAKAYADAPCSKHSSLTEARANAAVERIQKSGEVYYLGVDFVPPKLIQVKKAEARLVGKYKTRVLKLNGKTLEELDRVFVRADPLRPKVFVSLLAELGCSEDKDEILAEDVDPSKVLSWALGIDRVEASSALRGSEKYLPSAAVDGKSNTNWCEGKRGDGVGESITIHFAKARMMTQVVLQAGTQGYPTPAGIKIFLNQSKTPITDKLSAQFSRTEVSSMRIEISATSAHPLARTCIGELQFWDEDEEYGIIQGAKPKAMEALTGDMLALFAALNSCKASELDKYIDLPLTHYYASSDDGGHYEQESINLGNASRLARTCKKSNLLGARGTLIPWFDVLNHHHEHSTEGRLVIDTQDELSEMNAFWTMVWKGTHWRLESINDMPPD